MFRRVIENGDLILEKSSAWSLGVFRPYRNLSEEVRKLKKLEQDAMAKASYLRHQRNIAECNVRDELESLQLFLLENSKGAWYSDIEQSILEERDGVVYKKDDNKQKGNNNQGNQGTKDSSNKDSNNQNKQGNDQAGGKGGRPVSLLDLIMKGKVIMH